MTTLILCSSMPEAQDYYHEAKKRGEKIIATSSVHYDETSSIYETWEFLPNVYEDSFLSSLEDTTNRHNITRIYCPHDLVYAQIKNLCDKGDLAVSLIGETVAMQRLNDTRMLLEEAKNIQKYITDLYDAPPISLIHLAAILRQTAMTYGESSTSKLAATIGLFTSLPKGDVVEIGSLWGKMATALAMLARHYNIGSVLCIDPWQCEEAMQHDSDPSLRDLPKINDWDLIFTGFTIHTAAVATPEKFNYLRMTSTEAEKIYSDKKQVSSAEFGQTNYSGEIALIHIDGNHDYDCVRADYEAWRPHVMQDGWIILDDYVWQHGDGPKRLGDEIMQKEGDKIKRSFVAGKALFLQF